MSNSNSLMNQYYKSVLNFWSLSKNQHFKALQPTQTSAIPTKMEQYPATPSPRQPVAIMIKLLTFKLYLQAICFILRFSSDLLQQSYQVEQQYLQQGLIVMAHTQCGYILQYDTQCTTCCPAPRHPSLQTLPTFRKDKKYIKLTINKSKQPPTLIGAVVPQPDMQFKHLSSSSISEQHFRQEKSSFLEQIRNYSPGSDVLSHQKEHKQLDTTKELSSCQKNKENMLGTLLESMNNEIFSEMFVSSAVKGKVMLSGSLGSISEVKSEMELSNQTQGVLNIHYTQEK